MNDKYCSNCGKKMEEWEYANSDKCIFCDDDNSNNNDNKVFKED